MVLLAGCSAAPSPAPPSPPTSAAPAADNAAWAITNPGAEHAIEGFADRTSVTPGEPVRLFVSTTATTWTATAFRLGGDARRIWASAPQPGARQQASTVQEPTNTVVAPWAPSLTA